MFRVRERLGAPVTVSTVWTLHHGCCVSSSTSPTCQSIDELAEKSGETWLFHFLLFPIQQITWLLSDVSVLLTVNIRTALASDMMTHHVMWLTLSFTDSSKVSFKFALNLMETHHERSVFWTHTSVKSPSNYFLTVKSFERRTKVNISVFLPCACLSPRCAFEDGAAPSVAEKECRLIIYNFKNGQL